jgi:hypothetical protein
MLAGLSFLPILAAWTWKIEGGWAVLCIGFFIVTGFPAAMLTLHLGHPRWLFKRLERR